MLALTQRPIPRGTTWRKLLRLYRKLVGNGDAIQALAHRIDPGWQNFCSGRTPNETVRWLALAEVGHWALLAASIAPTAAAFRYGHYGLGVICALANILFNIFPNFVIRDTRRRLQRFSTRTVAASS